MGHSEWRSEYVARNPDPFAIPDTPIRLLSHVLNLVYPQFAILGRYSNG